MSGIPFELEALRDATSYQRWAIDTVAPFLGNRILEVGAGIGNMSQHIPVRELFVASEAEPSLVPQLKEHLSGKERTTVVDLDLSRPPVESFHEFNFDTVVSFNVLEHIEDDVNALKGLAELLRSSQSPGPKRIVTLVPAHEWAYGPIDKTYGHYRRYTVNSFREVAERAGIDLSQKGSFEGFYFNIVGLIGWFFYNRVLKSNKISKHSIKSVERLCPIMRAVDCVTNKLLRLPLGQSLVTVITL